MIRYMLNSANFQFQSQERSDDYEKSFLQAEGTLNPSNTFTTKSKTSEVQADSKGQSSSSVNTADIAVREDDAGAPVLTQRLANRQLSLQPLTSLGRLEGHLVVNMNMVFPCAGGKRNL